MNEMKPAKIRFDGDQASLNMVWLCTPATRGGLHNLNLPNSSFPLSRREELYVVLVTTQLCRAYTRTSDEQVQMVQRVAEGLVRFDGPTTCDLGRGPTYSSFSLVGKRVAAYTLTLPFCVSTPSCFI